jgi:hypothetical protein
MFIVKVPSHLQFPSQNHSLLLGTVFPFVFLGISYSLGLIIYIYTDLKLDFFLNFFFILKPFQGRITSCIYSCQINSKLMPRTLNSHYGLVESWASSRTNRRGSLHSVNFFYLLFTFLTYAIG